MGSTTKIEWCDLSWSPWHGCTEVHEGCDHCYARETAKRNPKTLGVWGPNGTRVLCANWDAPRKWNRQAEKAGKRMSVFPSICDPFEDFTGLVLDHNGRQLFERANAGGRYRTGYNLPLDAADARRLDGCATKLDELREDFFRLIDETPWLNWLLLTKRPENVRRMWPEVPPVGNLDPRASAPYGHAMRSYRPNVQLLTSVSNQATADAMIPELLKCRDLVPVLGVSAEPLLGPVEIRGPGCQACYGRGHIYAGQAFPCLACCPLDWVIVGGESGHHARPCNVAWVRSIRDQCATAGVPCFVKQLGSMPLLGWSPQEPEMRVRAENHQILALRDPKGGDWSEWSPDLRVRQFPNLREVPRD